jgi:hypothetical protein
VRMAGAWHSPGRVQAADGGRCGPTLARVWAALTKARHREVLVLLEKQLRGGGQKVREATEDGARWVAPMADGGGLRSREGVAASLNRRRALGRGNPVI